VDFKVDFGWNARKVTVTWGILRIAGASHAHDGRIRGFSPVVEALNPAKASDSHKFESLKLLALSFSGRSPRDFHYTTKSPLSQARKGWFFDPRAGKKAL